MLSERLAEAAAAVRERWSARPHAGVVLGTGLGSLAERLDVEAAIDFAAIPNMRPAITFGQSGRLLCGRIEGLPVALMDVRFHAYEGYTPAEIVFPVQLIRRLGAEMLIVSNVSGGMNPNYAAGDLVVIDDHINLMGVNPLIGPNDERVGPRFPDMSRPYDPALIDRALEIARRENVVAHRGVYVGVLGPNLETRAEYRFLRAIGADIVGMSTVPEVIAAVHSGLRVLGLSIVSDICLPDALKPVAVEEILRVAAEAEPKLRRLVLGVLAAEPRVV